MSDPLPDNILLPLATSDEPSLLPSDAAYSALWTSMPSYEMGSTEAVHKVVIHFRSHEDVDEFLELMGEHAWIQPGMGVKGKKIAGSMWFNSEDDYVAPREVIYTSDQVTALRYPIYIPSLGRWETPYTARALEAINVPHRVVVEPSQRNDYARSLGEERLLVLPEDFSQTKKSGSIPVRNWIWDHAVAEGHTRHWIIDDNVKGFLRVTRNRRIPVSDGAIFCAAEDFTDRWTNVALSGFNYMYFVNERSDTYPPFYLNTRVYSMILVNHALPQRWRGRYNEDTDLSLRALKGGWCTVLFNAFVGDKISTLMTKGGNTDTIYATGDKRRAFAESLVEQHPDVARMVWRYDRWHHEVDYGGFQANKLEPREGWHPPLDPEYGMRLVKRPVTTRYPRAPVRPITPVTLTPRAGSPAANGDPPPATPLNLLAPLEIVGGGPVDTSVASTTTTRPASKSCAHAAAPTPASDVTVTLMPRQPLDAREPTRSSGLASALAAPSLAGPATVTLGPRGGRYAVTPARPPARASTTTHSDPFLTHHARRLAAAGRGRLIFDAADWDHAAKTAVGLDVESFPNFFLVGFKRFSDGRRLAFEMSNRCELDIEGVRSVMERNVTVSFNGLNYDLPMIRAALAGDDTRALFELSQAIIVRNERQRLSNEEWRHVDLFNVNPSVRMGLKLLHGRLHGKYIVDLPFPPDTHLTPEQMNVVTLYCVENDLDATEGLRASLLGPLKMRHELGRRYDIDLMSKSDAQVGEAIVRARLGGHVGKPEPQYAAFRYTPPNFINFDGEKLNAVLNRLVNAKFTVDPGGKVTSTDWKEDLEVSLGEIVYSMGIGGLHSTETHRVLHSDGDQFLLDVDASSQYPNIIIGLGAMGLYPAAAGPNFVDVYAEMVKERLEAKATGDRVKADGLKIAVNGVGGKLASSYSFLYAPHMFLAMTLTGQLSILMLTEAVEDAGVRVVSANTDGLVFHCPRDREGALDEVLAKWEATVGMTLERTRYTHLYSRDVNTYIAVKEGGGTKRKGWVANPWVEGDLRGMMQKNPQMTVLSDAVVAKIVDGVPFEVTIDAASDPRAFVTVIQAKGGAEWRGQKLGRVVRYYWSTDGDPIKYINGGKRVAKTEGAKPLMELTDRVPADLDRACYIDEANKLFSDFGVGRLL